MKQMKRIGYMAIIFVFTFMSIFSTASLSIVGANQFESSTTTDGMNGIYEAENANFDLAIIDNKHVGFTGTGFVDYVPNAPGGWIEWTVNVPVDGEYTLGFRYAHGGGDLRPKEIVLNGEVINPELPFDPTGGWSTWEYSSMKADLEQGENVIRAIGIAPSGGANVDHLKVTLEFDEIFEAEEALFDAAIIDDKHPGFTGTGFVDYVPNAPGGWIEWTVDIPVAGAYFLDFRYAHGGGDLRPKEIVLNGEVVEPELAFDPTGGWSTWGYSSMEIDLTEGENVIRAIGIAPSGGANVDHLRVHNKEQNEKDDSIDLEVVDLLEVITENQLNEFKEMGLVVTDQVVVEAPISLLAFMALVNDALGLKKEEQFKNLSLLDEIWGVPAHKWYSFVLETAKDAGYMDSLIQGGTLNYEQTITQGEAAAIIDALGKTVTGLDQDTDALTWGEAKEIADSIRLNDFDQQNVEILAVNALANDLVAVTLNSYFENFDYNDLDVLIATRHWTTMSPGFRNIQISKAAKGTNQFGQTVLFFKSLEEWDEAGNFKGDLQEPTFTGDLEAAIEKAYNLVSWQMDHGGWTKDMETEYGTRWNGSAPRSKQISNGNELGTIDNDATFTEIQFLAEVYQETGDEVLKNSILRGFYFLLNMQYPSGGFPQVYPKRGNPGSSVYYSNYVTFNDEAMVNALQLWDDVLEQRYPFNNDLVPEEYYSLVENSMNRGLDYILKSQIEVDGVLTAWGQQHHPETYEPLTGRSYELPSITAYESVAIINFLMSRPNQTPEIRHAIRSALEWLDEVKVDGYRYFGRDPNQVYFIEDDNATMWYRFYEIGTNKPIFSGRDGVKRYSIHEVEMERIHGYAWAGNWPQQLMRTSQLTGYFGDKIFVQVANTNSEDTHVRTLQKDDIVRMSSIQPVEFKEFDLTPLPLPGIPDPMDVDNGQDPEPGPGPGDGEHIPFIPEGYEGIVLVDENFNDVETGSQPAGFTFGGDEGSVMELPHRTGKVLELPASNQGNSFTKAFDAQEGLILAQLDFMQPTRSNAAHVIALADASGTDVVRIETRDHQFKPRYPDNTFMDSGIENENGVWRNVAVIVDIPAQSFDLYIDGELILENQPFFNESTHISQVRSQTPGSSEREHYVDNLKVMELVEKEEPVESGNGPDIPEGFEEVVLINENFNSVETGAQPAGFTFGGDEGLVMELPHRTGKVLELPASNQGNSFAKAFDAQEGLVLAQLDFMQPTRSNAAHVIALADASGTDVVRIETRDHQFKPRYPDNTFMDSGIENENGVWRNVAVIVDIPAQSFDLYIDGELILENQPFFNESTHISQVRSQTPGSSEREHYVDNLKVSALVEQEEPPVEEPPVEEPPGEEEPPVDEPPVEEPPVEEPPVEQPPGNDEDQENDRKVIIGGVQTEVSGGDKVNIPGTNSYIVFPEDLPAGSSLTVEEVLEAEQGELVSGTTFEIAGDLYRFNFHNPNETSFDGSFTLIFNYNTDVYEAGDIQIYHFSGDTGQWTPIESVVDATEGTVSANVTSFSLYGVLAHVTEENEPSNGLDGDEENDEDKDPVDDSDSKSPKEDEEEKTEDDGTEEKADETKDDTSTEDEKSDDGEALPDTATNMYNMLLVGFILLAFGMTAVLVGRNRMGINVQK
ncbi:pectate lyase [Evansella sp. AB-P1]|uniref:pectate lyase n=1 Tax=Evansella sp. AB-P1 TaxID=3037653 RepID=UPI00241D7A8D|nr:pectate lyase [Evansella sp. AB-P1]MDG5786609.1 pectate lyase [Evansella sp. AB-P1]